MNDLQSRRRFLAEVGKGTLLATLGPALATELGITIPAFAGETGTSPPLGLATWRRWCVSCRKPR